MQKLWQIVVVGLALALTGCATGGGEPPSTLTEQLVIQYAVLKVVGDNPEKAQRVSKVAHDAKTFLNGDGVTLAALQAAVHDKIDWTKLDAADTLLVNALLAEVDRQLQINLGAGVLNPEALVQVNAVLDWIIAVTG
jgi:membrane peptidoglycan carboxypeptidase